MQAYFIASYAFGAGDAALDAHGFTGFLIIHGAELLVFLSSLVAFWGFWRWVGLSFLLFVIGTVQIFLAAPEEDRGSGWVHGLHGLGALIVLALAAYLAHRDMRLLGLGRQRVDTSAVAPPPAPPA